MAADQNTKPPHSNKQSLKHKKSFNNKQHDSPKASTSTSSPAARRIRLHEHHDDEPDAAAAAGPGAKVKESFEVNKAKRQQRALALRPVREKLPVWQGKEAILSALQENDTLVILGETGSGKTTQIPQFIMNSSIPLSQPSICVTQPRRVAAVALATRVAEEVGCHLGKAVGYTVRFDDKSTAGKTRLKFVTDGTLLQEMLADSLLERYDVLVVDEAHERSLRTDLVLGFLKRIQKQRREMGRPLKILVMSATLDAADFARFFDGAKQLYVKGRQHKVSVMYAARPQQDVLEATLKTVFQIHTASPPGDILVFLSGQEDIENLNLSLKSYADSLPASSDKILVCQLYAKLNPAEQAAAFAPTPPRTRKIILATNIAETSLTIPGIKYVVDTGLVKEKSFQSALGLDQLLSVPISRSSAQQRAGRAGRESAGTCYRIYTEETFYSLDDTQQPEILRCSLSFALLHLLASGQEDPFQFDYMSPPDPEGMINALLELMALGAVDEQRRITKLGHKMAILPLEPKLARILLASFDLSCPSEVLSLVALLGYADTLMTVPASQREAAQEAQSKFVHRDGDHLTLLSMLRSYESVEGGKADKRSWCKDNYINLKALANALEARKQLRERCERLGMDWKVSCGDETEPVLQSCLAGLFQNTAILCPDGTYKRAIGATTLKIHPSSVLHQKKCPAILFSELTMTTQTYARCVSLIPVRWLDFKMPLRPIAGAR